MSSPILSYNKLTKIVKSDGWQKVGQTGGHTQYKHPVKSGRVTIPYEINRNIQLSVLKQAGIDRNTALGRVQKW